MPREIVCAVYKGDELLGVGTYKELADQLNIDVSSVRFLGTPSYKKRIYKGQRNNFMELIKLEGDVE